MGPESARHNRFAITRNSQQTSPDIAQHDVTAVEINLPSIGTLILAAAVILFIWRVRRRRRAG